MGRFVSVTLLVSMLVAACGVDPLAPPVYPDDDIGYRGGDPESCESACENVRKSGCRSWKASCVDDCVAIENSGTISIGPKCIANTKLTGPECDEQERCTRP